MRMIIQRQPLFPQPPPNINVAPPFDSLDFNNLSIYSAFGGGQPPKVHCAAPHGASLHPIPLFAEKTDRGIFASLYPARKNPNGFRSARGRTTNSVGGVNAVALTSCFPLTLYNMCFEILCYGFEAKFFTAAFSQKFFGNKFAHNIAFFVKTWHNV